MKIFQNLLGEAMCTNSFWASLAGEFNVHIGTFSHFRFYFHIILWKI